MTDPVIRPMDKDEVEMRTIRKTVVQLLCLLTCIWTVPVTAEDASNEGITFVVPWPPGDLEDTLTRLIAEEVQRATGENTQVVNVPGEGGIVGAAQVAAAPADGLTVGSFVVDLMTTQPLAGNTPYALEDFEPLGIFLEYPFVLAVRADAPYDNLKQLAAYSRQQSVTLGHFGDQALPTVLTRQAADKLGIRFGGSKALDQIDCPVLLAGDVDVVTTTVQQLQACLNDGSVKLLVSMTRERLIVSDNTPTLRAETGIRQTTWNGLFVCRGTDSRRKALLERIASAAMRTEAAQAHRYTTGAHIFWLPGQVAQHVIEEDYRSAQTLLRYMQQ